MAALTPVPKIQFFDANGHPLAGGKLYSYSAGTTTPLVTYTDQAGTSANTNPVILDARGEASVWLGTGPYKLRLTTATDVDIWTVDDIYSEGALSMSELLSSAGSSLVGFIQSGANATYRTVQSKLRDTVSVKDFGAVGDGVADDYAAFVAALTASNNVFVPSGTYKLSANLPPLVSKVLRGENSVTTFLKPTAAVATAITLNSDSIISDFTIDGSNTTNATGVLVGSVITSPAQARDIAVVNFAGATGYGIYVSWAVGVNFYNVRSSTNGKGLFITNPAGAGSFPTYIVFNDCQFTFNNSHGAYIINAYGVTFNNCQFEYNTNEGLYAPSNGIVERLTLNNCWFERNFDSSGAAYQARFDGSAGGAVLSYTSLTNCYFANHTAKAAIFIKALATSFRSNQIPANAGTVLFNTNSYGWIVEQENTAYITDSTGFMQQFQPYVENSFVPTIVGATTAGVGTYTTQVGWYTKIGNLVTVTVSLTWTAHTGTGPIRVSNLPFAAKAAGGNPTATVITDGISLTAGNYASAYVVDGDAQIILTQCPTGGGAIATVPMDTAGSVQLTATYRI